MIDERNILKETGLVTKVENGVAWVNTASKLSCSSCQVSSTCGNGLLEKYLAGKFFVSKIPNQLQAKVGDQVEIGVQQSSITKAAFIVYWLPLAVFIISAVLGEQWFNTELWTILFSFSSFMLVFLLVRKLNKKYFVASNKFIPQMLAKKSTGYEQEVFQKIEVRDFKRD